MSKHSQRDSCVEELRMFKYRSNADSCPYSKPEKRPVLNRYHCCIRAKKNTFVHTATAGLLREGEKNAKKCMQYKHREKNEHTYISTSAAVNYDNYTQILAVVKTHSWSYIALFLFYFINIVFVYFLFFQCYFFSFRNFMMLLNVNVHCALKNVGKMPKTNACTIHINGHTIPKE